MLGPSASRQPIATSCANWSGAYLPRLFSTTGAASLLGLPASHQRLWFLLQPGHHTLHGSHHASTIQPNTLQFDRHGSSVWLNPALQPGLQMQDGLHELQGLVQKEKYEHKQFQDGNRRTLGQAGWGPCKCEALGPLPVSPSHPPQKAKGTTTTEKSLSHFSSPSLKLIPPLKEDFKTRKLAPGLFLFVKLVSAAQYSNSTLPYVGRCSSQVPSSIPSSAATHLGDPFTYPVHWALWSSFTVRLLFTGLSSTPESDQQSQGSEFTA